MYFVGDLGGHDALSVTAGHSLAGSTSAAAISIGRVLPNSSSRIAMLSFGLKPFDQPLKAAHRSVNNLDLIAGLEPRRRPEASALPAERPGRHARGS